MKTKKKNRFLTFCFSMWPGAAEMYMGFMKTGVSLMSFFLLIIMISVWLNQGVLIAAGVVVWFYGFFHANHLAGLSDEDFEKVQDEYLFGMDSLPGAESVVKKYHKWIAAILIALGIGLLWNSVAQLMADMDVDWIARVMWKIGNYLPSLVVGVVIIIAGIKMISGKKVLTEQEQESAAANENAWKEKTENRQEGE